MSDDETYIFLAKELIQRLCHELRGLIDNPNHNGDTQADMEQLKRYMLEYSKQKFAKKFGFEFEGNQSKPPNSKTGGRVLGYDQPIFLSHFPAGKGDVERVMDVQLFNRTDRNFPPFAAGDIYDDVRDHILCYSGVEGNPYPNEWGTAGFQQIYNDPTTPNKHDILHFSHFLHIHSDLTLDLPNGGSGRLEMTIVHFLGVFSRYESEW